jgi:hypothetical protein
VAATTTSAPDLQPHNRGDDTYGRGDALGTDSALLIGEQSGHGLAATSRKGSRGRLRLDLGKSCYELATSLLDLILN